MDGIGLGVLATFVGSVCALLWRHKRRQLHDTTHRVLCPLYGAHADVAVATDAEAPSSRQFVRVSSCSLVSNAAIGLPERVGYLWDGPPCEVRLDPARSCVYTADVACRQHCVDVLNATATSGRLAPVHCASGASDAIGLMEQAIGPERTTRLLWYSSL